VFPKLQKVASTSGPAITRQDTIDEMLEVDEAGRSGLARSLAASSKSLRRVDTIVETRSTLRKVDSYDGGLIKGLDATLDVESVVLPQQILPTTEYKELMANMLEFKVDVKLEVQRLNQKIGRLEELMSDLVTKLGDLNSVAGSRESRLDEEPPPPGPQPQRCIKVTARASSAIGVSSTTIPSSSAER